MRISVSILINAVSLRRTAEMMNPLVINCELMIVTMKIVIQTPTIILPCKLLYIP